MKPFPHVLVAVFLAGSLRAETVRLTDGTSMEVTRFEIRDDVVVFVTADGKLRTCLFSVVEHDLRSRLRRGASDSELCDYLHEVVGQKEARHHIGEPDFEFASRSMSCIGG